MHGHCMEVLTSSSALNRRGTARSNMFHALADCAASLQFGCTVCWFEIFFHDQENKFIAKGQLHHNPAKFWLVVSAEQWPRVDESKPKHHSEWLIDVF